MKNSKIINYFCVLHKFNIIKLLQYYYKSVLHFLNYITYNFNIINNYKKCITLKKKKKFKKEKKIFLFKLKRIDTKKKNIV